MKERLVQQIQVSLAEIESCSLFIDTAFIRKYFDISPSLIYSKQRIVGKNREWTFSNMPLATSNEVESQPVAIRDLIEKELK